MELRKEFSVGVSPERAWRTLTNPQTIACCLPGAELRPVDGVHAGRVKLSDAGDQIWCEALLRMIDRDDDEQVATFSVHGRQLGGPAIGSVTFQGRVEPINGSARIVLSAEVRSSGHRPVDEVVRSEARRLVDQVAEDLSERMQQAPAPVQRAQEPKVRRGLATASGIMMLLLVLRGLVGRRHSPRR